MDNNNLEKKINELFDDEPINIDELLNSNLDLNNSFSFKDSSKDEIIKKENKLPKQDNIKEEQIYNNKKEKKKFNFDIKKIISFIKLKKLYYLVFLIIIILVIVFIYIFASKQKIVVCNFSSKDTGYIITDKYTISKKGNKIISVIGNYKFKALNDEWKAQISYIKNEKSSVIINSNGYKGFTFTYEEDDNTYIVNSYLDFNLFDYKQISKVNQSKTPINYFEINKNLTYKKLVKKLRANGFICEK